MLATWVASFAAACTVVVSIVALLLSHRAQKLALEAQAAAMRDAREHEFQTAREERLWHKRADLYARIAEALRAHVEAPGEQARPAAGDPSLAGLMSEADVFASREVADLLAQFLYSDPDDEQEIDIWGRFQSQALSELIHHRAD
jgi:hypothetical protein